MSGFPRMNEWEQSQELKSGRNHIARLMNMEEEGAYEVDDIPVVPFGQYRGKPLDLMHNGFIVQHYLIGNFDLHSEAKDWIEKRFPQLKKEGKS